MVENMDIMSFRTLTLIKQHMTLTFNHSKTFAISFSTAKKHTRYQYIQIYILVTDIPKKYIIL